MNICFFVPTGRTYSFRDIESLVVNETVITFDYKAMSDGKTKHMTVYRDALVGFSTHE